MHKNNFDFLRTFFAFLVIISHSYDLLNISKQEPLYSMIPETSMGYWGVRGFFIISGFLVFQSLMRSKNLTDYLWKRALRIYPALCILLILTLLILPFIYTNKDIPFLVNKATWTYFPNNISLFFLQYEIPGIFEDNPFPKVINGSLWTLRYEFFFYLLLVFFLFFRKNIVLTRVVLFGAYMINYFLYFYFTNHNPTSIKLHFTDLSLYFLAGSLLASYRFDRLVNRQAILYSSIFLFLLSIHTGPITSSFSRYLLYPLIVISWGLMSTPFIHLFSSKIGDLSYGIYISSFFIQQLLLNFYKLPVWQLILFTFIISTGYGYFSWNLIEKRVLTLKSSFPDFLIYFKRKKT